MPPPTFKVAVPPNPTSVFNPPTFQAVLFLIRGANATNPATAVHKTSGFANASIASPIPAPGVTTTIENCLLLHASRFGSFPYIPPWGPEPLSETSLWEGNLLAGGTSFAYQSSKGGYEAFLGLGATGSRTHFANPPPNPGAAHRIGQLVAVAPSDTYVAGGNVASNDGPDNWTDPSNAEGVRDGIEASRVGQLLAATDANLRLTYANPATGIETGTITSVILAFDTRQTGTALLNGGLHHEYRIGNSGPWTSLGVFTGDIDNNPITYDITAVIAGSWASVDALQTRVRAVLGLATSLITCFCDAVELRIQATGVDAPQLVYSEFRNGFDYVASVATPEISVGDYVIEFAYPPGVQTGDMILLWSGRATQAFAWRTVADFAIVRTDTTNPTFPAEAARWWRPTAYETAIETDIWGWSEPTSEDVWAVF